MQRLSDWYSHPEYYEAIFGAGTADELAFLQALNAQHGTGGRLWLEPACGAGRLVEAAARTGVTVWGYDVSEAMLAHARRRLPPAARRRVHLAQGRMEDFLPAELEGRVDLAFNLVSTFRYLSSEAAALAHLRCVRRMLRPGGLYALGYHLTDYARAKDERERWMERLGADTVVCNTREGLPDRRRRRAPMRNRLRVTGPDKDLLIETEWFFRTYDDRQARALYRKAGLVPLAAYTFDYDLAHPLPRGSLRLDRVWVLTPAP